ncbi:MAG: AAA family ATPase [Candidatus Marinimicrobia bacterium]|nr:AAA family ATPase [Candidatus Neomarinimicrobiota bacterium]|tara:strand:- start:2045 stop:3013 length:969 start_codon:yes stop_codon:yes gene_type:complete
MDNVKVLEKINNQKNQFYSEISKIIVGQGEVIEHIFIALLCRGHILLQGVPGLGKTLIIKTISEILELNFNRIQFTPDLMPSDITGTEIISQNAESGNRELKFIKGPIFSNIILADEINRTPPKTQSALLEAMQENRVTTGGTTYNIEEPFFVLATQNPIEQEGTYPLPEAQLDRFMFNVLIDYPSIEEEEAIVKSNTSQSNNQLNAIITKDDLLSFQNLVMNVPISDNVINYAVNFVHSTRPSNNSPDITNKYIQWGAGPRASSYLILAAKAKAILNGKATPDIDDVKSVIKSVLRHRINMNFNAEAEGIKIDSLLEQLMD